MSIEIVDAMINKDADAFKSAFDNAISSKIADALEIRKVEIGSTLIAQEPEDVNDSEENFETDSDDYAGSESDGSTSTEDSE